MQDSEKDADLLNSLLDSVGEGEGGMITLSYIFFFNNKILFIYLVTLRPYL